MDKFVFGTVTVPDGQRGDWTINTFTLTDADVMIANLRAARDGNHEMICPAGTYKRLVHKRRGCIMSNTRMEIITAVEAYRAAKGRVLINGLGLGMVLEGVLSKPEVTFVRVIEFDADVIAFRTNGEFMPAKEAAIIRHLVASANACAGISAENLEDNIPIKELATRYNKALRQRDELLAAIEQFLDPEGNPPADSGEWREVMRVIASVKGGAA